MKNQNVKLPLHFGLIRLDLNGDGADEPSDETLWRIYPDQSRTSLGNEIRPADAEAFVIGFDYADALWLADIAICCRRYAKWPDLDQQPLFDAVGRHLFAKADAPLLPEAILRQADRPFEEEIADAIAAIHLAHFRLKEPQRMKSAMVHLQQVIKCSRGGAWQAIEAEGDDDQEWIPSSKQAGVIPGVRIARR